MSDRGKMQNAWNQVAVAYQKRYQIGTDQIHYGPLCPSEDKLQLIGELRGKRALEIGSGAGQNAIYMASQGAKVVAADISDAQLAHGAALAKKQGVAVKFIQASFNEFAGKVPKTKFDIVLSVYALQYCYDLQELKAVFKNIASVLKRGGRFVFSLDHPLRSHGYWDDQNRFIAGDYFDRTIKTWNYNFPEINKAPEMSCNYKTIGDYFNALTEAGLTVTKLLEPEPVKNDPNSQFGTNSQYGHNNKRDPFSYEHLSQIPGTIIFQAVKGRIARPL